MSSSFALNYGITLATFDETFETYKRIVIISDQIVRIGAVGTLLVASSMDFLQIGGFSSSVGLR
ncbi:hypothetical protein [Bacillus salipaludis]|uniref:hypothetical protein n=1 Tax=Bacillus salipaludis TaxID=2547811 RepID=UPI002E24C6EE|nr:hypothetical protein [Bacillus salipaludis]